MGASSLQMLNKWKPVLLYRTQQWSALPGLRDSESIMEQRVFAASCWGVGRKMETNEASNAGSPGAPC